MWHTMQSWEQRRPLSKAFGVIRVRQRLQEQVDRAAEQAVWPFQMQAKRREFSVAAYLSIAQWAI